MMVKEVSHAMEVTASVAVAATDAEACPSVRARQIRWAPS